MKFIIFSDVHSNLESLQAFQQEIASIDHDMKVCLGDLVGYGADPNPCLDWIRESADIVLAGNHDFAAVNKTDTDYFNPYALESCHWTRTVLTPVNQEYLQSLSADRVEAGVHWTHASPFEPEKWHYVTSANGASVQFENMQERVCFFGHTHLPLVLEQDAKGIISDYVPGPIAPLRKQHRYLINVGSLGQPRDGDPRPLFVVYDSDNGIVEFRRYEYDIPSAQQKIVQAALPKFLADRLSRGQ